MLKDRKVLLLTLYTFSLTGGIEKVCRSIVRALNNLSYADENGLCFTALSMYDTGMDFRYTDNSHFKCFRGKKLKFARSTIKEGLRHDYIILSHINLLIFGWIIKKVRPNTRIILIAHGIEIWNKIPLWKISFLKKNNVFIWAVSHFTAEQLEKNHGIDDKQVEILNNCLDPFFQIPAHFEKPERLLKKYDLKSNQRVLLTVCRLSADEQYKGYDKVIQSMKTVLKDFPAAHYILAGKADISEELRLKDLIKNEGVTENVTLTGYIEESELNEHYLLADAFVMPSQGEGFGISFIEAAACGCPPIAGNTDGSRDALLGGRLGILINPDSIVELNNAIDSLFKIEIRNTASDLQNECIKSFSFQSYQNKVFKLLLKENELQ